MDGLMAKSGSHDESASRDESGPAGDEAILAAARKDYERCRDAWKDNQDEARDDLRFGRLGEQWPDQIRRDRERENRPCLTFNKMPAFVRQVVNDARQNKPQIKVHPQDSGADPKVAEIISGLIRNIETSSDADVAYDTAIEHAVGQGFGFWRINTRYTSDDAFDQDIVIERVSNPFTIYGDPRSTAADSSDWNLAFVITTMSKDEYKRDHPDAEKVDWDSDFRDCPDWLTDDAVTVAEYWTREKVRREIVALSDGSIIGTEELKDKAADLGAAGLAVVGEPREVESWKVTQRLISGAEVLKTVEWAGKYIPIVPGLWRRGDRRGRQAPFPLADPRRQIGPADAELLAHDDDRAGRARPQGAVGRRGRRVRRRSELGPGQQRVAHEARVQARRADAPAPALRRAFRPGRSRRL
jgi:hypothetical protein